MADISEQVLEAIVDKQYDRSKAALRKLGELGDSVRGVYPIVWGANTLLFENKGLLNHHLKLFLMDANTEMPKISRYRDAVNFLGSPLNYFKSFPAGILLSSLPFLNEGVEIDVKNSEGKPVRVSVDYVRDELLAIIDDLQDVSAVVIKYLEGMTDAYNTARADPLHFEESRDIETFVRDGRAELYSLMRAVNHQEGPFTASSDIVTSSELLRKNFESFSRKYLTGPNGLNNEYSHILNRPFDLLLTTAKALVHIGGDEKRWSGIIRFFFQPKSNIYQTVERLESAGDVGNEMREDAHYAGEQLYTIFEQGVRLAKEYTNLAARDWYTHQMHLINTLGTIESQRKVVERYSP